MKEATPAWPAAPSPFAGSDWFDPLEDAVRSQVRAFIEALLEEELEAALGRRRSATVSCPILACNSFTSTAAGALEPPPNTPAAPSRSCARQAVIWFA